jgi:putative transposase
MSGLKKTSEAGRVLGNPKILVQENLYFSISEQYGWYGISRGQYYHQPRVKDDQFIKLKEKIREKYILDPSSGSRRISADLNRDGVGVKRGLVRRLMREMSLRALTPKKKVKITTVPAHKLPYLLKDLEIVRPNQVWSTDITYIKTERGHMYLTAIMDVYSRKILSWELSNSLSMDFCVKIFKEAVEKHGAPEILNTDQGSQFSMDGKGRCLDKVG